MSKVDEILRKAQNPQTAKQTDPMDSDAFFDSLEIDEAAIEAKQAGGGEAIAEDDGDCEGCKI